MLKIHSIFSKKCIQGYSEEEHAEKLKFHSESKKLLKAIAKELNISDFDLRSNMAGPAVSGEITLHSENIYLQIYGDGFGGEASVLFRTCTSKKDYTGGQNNYFVISKLKEEYQQTVFLNKCKQLLNS